MVGEKYKISICGVGMVGGALRQYFEKMGKEEGKNLFLYDPPKGFDSIEDLNKADIVFIAVPTPYLKDDSGFDLSYVKEAVGYLKEPKIIVIKSTVVPGTTESLQKEFPKHKFLFNPEFLTELTADQDMQYPDRQILGVTKQSYGIAGTIMQLLPLAPFEKIMPATEAELVKYYGNNWFAVKVTFANQMFDLCEKLGIDYERVMESAAADKRIGRSHLTVWHKGYRGYGGRCIPKDIRAMIQFADKKGVDMQLLKKAEEINNKLMEQQNIKDPETFSKREG